MKILAVEDELVSRKLLKLTLESQGHEVTCCEDGLAAWDLFKENPNAFQVIVSDWLMPNLDGLDFCKNVRGLKLANPVYFIILTANNRRINTYNEAITAGIDDFLAKPLNECDISSRLNVAARTLEYINRVNELEQLFPICSHCHNSRETSEYQEKLDAYFSTNLKSLFRNSICSHCAQESIHAPH